MGSDRRAVVVTHSRLRESGTVVPEAVDQLRHAGFQVSIVDNVAAPRFGGDSPRVDPDTEIVVVLGGDGTILRAAEPVSYTHLDVYKRQIPDRLDAALVALGLVESRAKAQRLIKSGKVMVDGVTATKPAQTIASASDIAIDKGDDYVSRGAYKLVGAFDAFRAAGLPEPVGFDCLDIGASTGGFCDVLLRRGARRVIALDVGHGQLDPRIADDPRIIEMSGVNIRDVRDGDLPYRCLLYTSRCV